MAAALGSLTWLCQCQHQTLMRDVPHEVVLYIFWFSLILLLFQFCSFFKNYLFFENFTCTQCILIISTPTTISSPCQFPPLLLLPNFTSFKKRIRSPMTAVHVYMGTGPSTGTSMTHQGLHPWRMLTPPSPPAISCQSSPAGGGASGALCLSCVFTWQCFLCPQLPPFSPVLSFLQLSPVPVCTGTFCHLLPILPQTANVAVVPRVSQ